MKTDTPYNDGGFDKQRRKCLQGKDRFARDLKQLAQLLPVQALARYVIQNRQLPLINAFLGLIFLV